MRKAVAPLLLLLAIGLFVVAGFQFGGLLVDWTLNFFSTAEEQVTARGSDNVFRNIGESHPKQRIIEERLRQRQPKPLKFEMPVFSHNLTEGPYNATVRLTVFNDPACLPCNQQVESVLAGINRTTVRVVHKFMPADAVNFRGGQQDGGIFRQLAKRHAVWPQVKAALLELDTPPTLTTWITLLEDAGVPLQTIRQDMQSQNAIILRNLELDRALGEEALVDQVPAFFVNEFFIDGKMLTLGNLNRSIQRLQNNRPILTSRDMVQRGSAAYGF